MPTNKGIDGLATLIQDSFELDPYREQSTPTVTYTVIRKLHKKKRNDAFLDGIEVEEIHHHPANAMLLLPW